MRIPYFILLDCTNVFETKLNHTLKAVHTASIWVFREVCYFAHEAPSEDNPNSKDPYACELESQGFSIKTISVLDFTYKNLDSLKSKLLRPDSYSGIILTSPRCVRAVSKAVGSGNRLDERWQQLHTFSVGEATAQLATDLLGLDSEGSCAGNGATLAPIIISRKPTNPLLLPCGNLKMNTLENLLEAANLVTDCVEVYETVPHPELESTLKSALAETTPSYVTYFSPSGLHSSYPLLRQSGIDLEKIKWVAIGPTTAAAIESYGLPVHCSADKPNPRSLADALTSSKS